MRRIYKQIPENLTFEQFRVLADRQPSLEGNWLYRLTHETLRDNYEYPEFRIHPTRYMFYSFDEAEKYMREKLAFLNERNDTYRFLIEQIPIGERENETGAAWVYSHEGKIIDISTTIIKDGEYPQSCFFGRSKERIRFQEGDIVEIVEGDTVHLAIVGAEGPTVEWFWGLYGRSMIERNKFGKGYYGADYSDDCYYVIDAPGCHAHPHVTSVMKPRLPIPQDIREYLEDCLAMSKSRDDHYDRRIIGMDNNIIFEAATVDINLRYEIDSLRHILSIRTTDNITDTVSERELPQDFSEDELHKIIEWLNFKKYGKSRLWYLIKDWNEYYSSDKIPALSPDISIEELLNV